MRTRLIPLLLVATLTGCFSFFGSGSPKTRFYMLEADSTPAQAQSRKGTAVSIGLGPLNLPDSLNRPQIVTRDRAHQRVLGEFDHWAGSLQENMVRVLASGLIARLPAARVQRHPWPHAQKPTYQVRIDVLAMEGSLGGETRLRGAVSWLRLPGGEELHFEQFDFRGETDAGDYAALVASWSGLVNQLAGELAAQAKSFPARESARTGPE